MLTVTIGWIGTILYLANHAYITLVKQWRHKIYYGGNLAASFALVISSITLHSWQAVWINLFWFLISLLLILKVKFSEIPIQESWLYYTIFLIFLYILSYYLLEGKLNIKATGWSSSVAFCFSYLLFSTNRLSIKKYFFWNCYAAAALLPQLYQDNNWPVFFLEIAWFLLSMHGLINQPSNAHLID